MSVGDSYLAPQEYRHRVGSEDSSKDLLISFDLAAVSRLVEKNLGQYFNRDAAATIRLFRAKYSDLLDLTYEGGCPGIAALTDLSIKVDTDGDGSFADETVWSAGDYELLPLQAASGPEARPWDRIRTVRGGSKSFSPGNLVQVTAIFGWPEVPELIKALTARWTEIWRLDGPSGTGRINELGVVVNVSLDVKRLLDRAREAYMARVTF